MFAQQGLQPKLSLRR